MNRLFGHLLAGFNALASAWVLFLVTLISADVIGRNALNSPIPGVPEIVKFSIVGMVWLWMAYALRTGAHLRTKLALAILPRIGQRAVLAANSLLGVFMFVFIAWLGWYEMMKSWDIGAFEGEHPVRIPVWPLWGILVVGAAVTAIQFALDTIRQLSADATVADLSEPAE